MNSFIKILTGGMTGLLTYLFGGFDLIFSVLVTFIVVDYITGFLSAVCNRELSSIAGFKGIFKKVGIILIIVIAHLAGQLTGNEWIRAAVIGFYIANEGISILENIGGMGIPFPDKLLNILKQLKDDE